MSAKHRPRDSVHWRSLADDVFKSDQQLQQVLVFEELETSGSNGSSVLIVKVDPTAPPSREAPPIFGFPPTRERPFAMGLVRVHPSQVPDQTIGFDCGGAWGGPAVYRTDERRMSA